MRLRSASALVLCAATLALTGCRHHRKVVQTAALTPPPVGPVMVSVPPPTHHDEPAVNAASLPASKPETTAPRHAPRPKRTAPAPGQSAANTAPAVAPAAPPIALGELSAGGESSKELRQQTADLLKAQQQRVDTLSHNPNANAATQIAQAKAFLQRATASWNAADYEGAHTLAVKAKVLLDDLKL